MASISLISLADKARIEPCRKSSCLVDETITIGKYKP